ncbi:MAG: M56 family metallopeptidase [Gemmatimonadaceae bacterium]
MTAAWIVYLFVAGTLLALAARAIATALSLAGRSTRWVWAATLAAILALGLFAPRVQELDVVNASSAMPAASTAQAAEPIQPSVGALIRAIRIPLESALVGAIATMSGGIPGPVARLVVIGWSLASGMLLVIYLVVNLRIARARRHWPRERIHGVEVRVAPTAGPAVIGVLRAEIVVPRSLLERSVEEQRLIIAHEHEHLRARDNVLLGLACVVVIVLPWHPAVWYILTQLRLAIELDCDARVLRRGAAPRSYGALLIDMAAQGAGIRVGTLALADRPSHLERRLLAMRTSRSRFSFVRGGALSAVAGLLVLVACEAKIPTAAEISSMDVASAEKAGASSGAFGRLGNADFFLDGVKKTREEVLAISGEQIGSIEIVKGGRDTVFVTSKERMKVADSAGAESARLAQKAGMDTSLQVKIRTPINTSGAQPAFMIDGVLVSPEAFAALRPEYIRSVDVRKPTGAAADRQYPNGLIVVRTGKTPIFPKQRVPGPTSVRRTDTMVVNPARGTASASRLLSQIAQPSLSAGDSYRIDLVPAREPALSSYSIPIDRVVYAGPTTAGAGRDARPNSGTLVPVSRKQLMDYAITIDGSPATRADVDALSKSEQMSATMWVRDGEKHSSDPKAGNGLMEIKTRSGTWRPN